jgi:hypothetical protein
MTCFLLPRTPGRNRSGRLAYFGWLGVAERWQPGGGAAGAASGVHDQVSPQCLLAAGAAVGSVAQDADAGDTVLRVGGNQVGGLAFVDDLDVGQCPDPGAYLPFQILSAGLHESARHRYRLVAHPMATEGRPRLGEVAHDRSSVIDEIGKQPGKELLKDRGAAWQQRVNVPSLGHATTVLAIARQAVPVGDRHLFVCTGQHPRGEQATDAGTNDHRVRTDLPHLTPPAS